MKFHITLICLLCIFFASEESFTQKLNLVDQYKQYVEEFKAKNPPLPVQQKLKVDERDVMDEVYRILSKQPSEEWKRDFKQQLRSQEILFFIRKEYTGTQTAAFGLELKSNKFYLILNPNFMLVSDELKEEALRHEYEHVVQKNRGMLDRDYYTRLHNETVLSLTLAIKYFTAELEAEIASCGMARQKGYPIKNQQGYIYEKMNVRGLRIYVGAVMIRKYKRMSHEAARYLEQQTGITIIK